MRYFNPLLIALVAVPSATQQTPLSIQQYAGRGFINPPTVDEIEQISCLATMVYGEARGETKEGMAAVAHTAKNRAVNKALCDVVLAPKQYSIFNNNPALRDAALSPVIEPLQRNVIEQAAWRDALAIATDVIRNIIPDPTNGSTHYLAPAAMKKLGYKYPKWSREFAMVAIVDNHHFYKPVDKAMRVALK